MDGRPHAGRDRRRRGGERPRRLLSLERLDGSGYPDGLSGEFIPLTARVTTIADIFDALTTARVYRAALTRTEALTIMAEEAGRGWWDPRLLDTFRSVLEGLPEDVSRVTNSLAAPP